MKNIEQKLNVPIIVHIPHSSVYIPSRYRNTIVLSEEELKVELLKITDLYCDVLFNTEYETIIFPINRLICDVERFRDDTKEVMAQKGMGVIYTSTSDNRMLKQVNEDMKGEILNRFYDHHHLMFENSVKKMLEKYNKCLIIDGHSFGLNPLPFEINQSKDRPDFCIGSDGFHTPADLVLIAVEFFNSKGYKVKINQPFAGSIVPIKYYMTNKNVSSIMIEVNRSLYMNEETGKKKPEFQYICNILKELMNLFENWIIEK